MKRRDLLKAALAMPFSAAVLPGALAPAWAAQVSTAGWRSRVRPGDPAWPPAARWDALKRNVDGRLLKLQSPFASRGATPTEAAGEALKQLKNPFYIGDQPALTQTSGWADAWTSQPSVYAVAAENTADVVAAVNSRASIACDWWSRAAATATRAPPMRRIRCWCGCGT